MNVFPRQNNLRLCYRLSIEINAIQTTRVYNVVIF